MINSIRLQNFRSYGDESFEFDPGVNIVVGPNASGKTNLLEAVLVLSRGSSYRAKDNELIKFGQDWTRLDGFFDNQTRVLKLEKTSHLLAKSYLLDEKPYKRLSLERTVPVVYFEPNHLQIIIRGPDQRRSYFDEILERSRPGFKTTLNSYQRVLTQRNSLLKQGHHQAKKQIFAWNLRLAELGEKIAEARVELIDELNKDIKKAYKAISNKPTTLSVEYKSQFPVKSYGSRLISKLEANADEDYARGFTSYGPHREDFIFYLDGQNASASASRGENRSIMLALKIYELGLIEKVASKAPIFLLDDVFSELDGARRRALVEFLANRQTIITTTDADSVIEHFGQGHRLIALT